MQSNLLEFCEKKTETNLSRNIKCWCELLNYGKLVLVRVKFQILLEVLHQSCKIIILDIF